MVGAAAREADPFNVDVSENGTGESMKSESEVFSWSTNRCPERKKLNAYRDMLAEKLISVTTQCESPDDFRCDLQGAALENIFITDISGSAKTSTRTRVDIERHETSSFHLAIGQNAWSMESGRNALDLNPRDVVFIDTRLPYTSYLPDNYVTRTINMPKAWCSIWLADPAALGVRKIPYESGGWARILSDFLAQLAPVNLSEMPVAQSVLSDQLGALVAAALSDFNKAKANSKRNDTCARIVDRLRQRCTESDLTASEIAASLNISLRTMHRALADGGYSFGSLLIRSRAEIAFRMLRSMSFNRLSVAEISRRAGFINQSHFGRVCREMYGASPTDIRGS